MPLNVCRFNPAHTFPNPVALRRHYETEHAHEWEPKPNPKVRCVVNGCGKVHRLSNVHSHMMREHGNRTSVGSYVEVPEETPLTPRTFGIPAKLNGNHEPDSTGKVKAKHLINRCDLCGWVTKRGNMGKHFLNKHKPEYHTWRSHVTEVQPESTAIVVAELPELVSTIPAAHAFAMHADGQGYTTDDFWLPVVAQLAEPEGVIPVEAMAALGAFRDDVGRMLHAVTHLQPRRRR